MKNKTACLLILFILYHGGISQRLSIDDVDIKGVKNHVLTQLMQQDEWLLKVNKKSLAQIMQRKNSLELCNQYLGEFSHSLNMANMHLRQSQQSMKKAKGSEEEDCFAGLVGGFHLVEAWDEQTNDLELDRLLHSCTLIKKN